MLQVNPNTGVLSFGGTFSRLTPDGLNFDAIISNTPIIAPFWNFIDLLADGIIYYRRDTDPNTRNLANQEVRSIFPEFPQFDARLVVVVTYDRVARFGEFTGLVNTFQTVIASDGSNSFVRFTYGNIEWGDNSTLIGVSAGDGENFITHPLSFSPNLTQSLDNTAITYRIDGEFTSPCTIL